MLDTNPPKSVPSRSQLRVNLCSAILARPDELTKEDVVILFGYGCAAAFSLPSIRKQGELIELEIVSYADIIGVLKVVSIAPDVARGIDLLPPDDSSFEEALISVCERLLNWEAGIEPGTPRAIEIERQRQMIDHEAGLNPNVKTAATTMTGIVADNLGEDFDRSTESHSTGSSRVQTVTIPNGASSSAGGSGFSPNMQMGRPCSSGATTDSKLPAPK